jgi:beta-phosphoglucomutase-like phosphatase (HAD superfamily)
MDETKRRQIAREIYADMPEGKREQFMELVRKAAAEVSEDHGIDITPQRVADFLLEMVVEDIHAIASEHITDEVWQRIVAEEHDRLRQTYPFGPVQAREIAAAATARIKREYERYDFRSKS